MIDSHCHLNLPPLCDDIPHVLATAKQNGLKRLMVPGITPESWSRLRYFQNTYSDILPIDIAIGLHPYFLLQNELPLSKSLALLEKAIDSNVRAIGETGLDGHISVCMKMQKQSLHAHLNLAEAQGLPVVLHHRKSHHLLLEALKSSVFSGSGVIHAFSGSIDVAKRYIDKGFYLGIGGTITYERAKKTRDTVAHLLRYYSDRILLETDAPDMPMSGRQGKANMPGYITDVIDAMTALSDIEPSELINITTTNYNRLFNI